MSENIEFIVATGYYPKDAELSEAYDHTEETRDLYQKGWESVQDVLDLTKEADVYEGVVFIDGEPFAQYILEDSDKPVHYRKIEK